MDALVFLLHWGHSGFFSVKGWLAPAAFLCKHLVHDLSRNWFRILSHCMVQGIFMYFGISCFSRRSVTHWTVPACLSYLHREGNLVSKRAICKIFGNVLLVCFVVFFFLISWIWSHCSGWEWTQCEPWIWMTSASGKFESRLESWDRKLKAQSWCLSCLQELEEI